jgi:hypothetical protein
MFDPKQITSSMLGCAPQFVLTRFPSVIMGVIVAYGVLLFFLGQPPFFQRVGELGLVMAACYYAARGVRYAMMRVAAFVEGPEAVPTAAAAAGAQPSAASSTASPKQSASQRSASAVGHPSSQKEGKALD